MRAFSRGGQGRNDVFFNLRWPDVRQSLIIACFSMLCGAHGRSACANLAISWGLEGRWKPPNGVLGKASKAIVFVNA